jgi:predicted nucleotidyltransferase
MRALSESQIGALRELKGLWPDAEVSLIGASALTCLLSGFHRQTLDLDVTIAISVDELPSELRKLAGWKEDPQREHRWITPTGLKVDLIPAGAKLLAAGRIVWRSGQEMSLLGFRHAFTNVSQFELGSGLHVDVASVPVITLLKMVAYQERPHDRRKDLGDIAFALENYISEDDRRRFSDQVLEAEIRYEQVSPYLLGRDLAELVDDTESRSVKRFVSLAMGQGDGGMTQAVMRQEAPIRSWREHPDEFDAAMKAFERGIEGR